ncbi:hypothetical protein EMA8858_01302 [Emticicia aquatica]|uniref:Methane oxygenase PmoA n=1 Tax=Emticicia aquatica TaxID=1681835 RepID=A0ABN8EW88_9BACT|nr:PmoA family protein [Emticicia aquatica]CAH0995182.1 hypothetical protein EMA8858_01302 [Emticicia aquatica]
MKTKLTILLICGICINVFGQAKIVAQKFNSKIDISINNNLFTSYIFSQDEKYPFFFPVNGPSNASVTSMRNGNYPHHSSLFFGCDKVNGGNYWQEGLERGQIISLRADIIESGNDKVVIEDECIWRRPNANAPIKDLRKITITAPSKELFQIDFDIIMEMLMDVVIEKTNHSLFSGRMDADLAVINGGTMINANGEKGEKETFGKKSAWIDFYGKRGDKIEGMAIFQHPSNEWYPSPWFTRDYGFFSPTPMYWPSNDKETTLKKGQTIKLKYRVIVHSGDVISAKIAEQFEKYKAE